METIALSARTVGDAGPYDTYIQPFLLHIGGAFSAVFPVRRILCALTLLYDALLKTAGDSHVASLLGMTVLLEAFVIYQGDGSAQNIRKDKSLSVKNNFAQNRPPDK